MLLLLRLLLFDSRWRPQTRHSSAKNEGEFEHFYQRGLHVLALHSLVQVAAPAPTCNQRLTLVVVMLGPVHHLSAAPSPCKRARIPLATLTLLPSH